MRVYLAKRVLLIDLDETLVHSFQKPDKSVEV